MIVSAILAVLGIIGFGIALVDGGDEARGDDRVGAGPRATTSTIDLLDVAPTLPGAVAVTTSTIVVPPAGVLTTPPTLGTTTTAPRPPLTGDGAVLQTKGVRTETREMQTAGNQPPDCTALADKAFSEAQPQCGVVAAPSGRLVWMVEGTDGATRTSVWRETKASTWAQVLVDKYAAKAEPTANPATVKLRAEDVNGKGVPELVFGFRYRGTSADVLSMDVVEAAAAVGQPPAVVVHEDLIKGAVRVTFGRIETWGGTSAEPNPAEFQHELIQHREDAYRVTFSERVPANQVLESEL